MMHGQKNIKDYNV